MAGRLTHWLQEYLSVCMCEAHRWQAGSSTGYRSICQCVCVRLTEGRQVHPLVTGVSVSVYV